MLSQAQKLIARLTLACAAAVALSALHAAVAGDERVEVSRLVIGTRQAAPFSMKDADGSWRGISIELWQRIADRLGIVYDIQEEPSLTGLLEGVRTGRFDAAVAAFTVTAERERILDFTHPFHTTGLAIAVRPVDGKGWLSAVEPFFSIEFLQILGGLALLLLGIGFLVWLAERKANPEYFGGTPLQGIGSGFYWSAVTMTTVGYGDKVATTTLGRILSIIWMFTAVVIISSFTAAIASSLTIGRMEAPIQGPEDLPKVRVATVASSTSEAYLRRELIRYSTFATTLDALKALSDNDIDAVVYDAPIINYMVTSEFRGRLAVLPQRFERQDYAIVLPENSELRTPVNLALLEEIRSQQWRETLSRYLGTR